MVLLGGVIEAEKRHGVGHHPDVSAAAVVVRFAPVAVLVVDQQNVLRNVHGAEAVKTWWKQIRKNYFKTQKDILYRPALFGHFLDPPGNHPRGAIFPTVD